MTRNVLSALDDWCANGVDRVGAETLKLFRECSHLRGMPAEFYRRTNASNFQRRAKVLKQKKVAASRALSRALLRSRDFEDAGNLPAAIRTFERLKHRTDATFYLAIAQREIARLRRLSGGMMPSESVRMNIASRRLEFFPINGVFGRFGRGVVGFPMAIIGALFVGSALMAEGGPSFLFLVAALFYVSLSVLAIVSDVSSVTVDEASVTFALPFGDWRIPREQILHVGFWSVSFSSGGTFWVRITGRWPVLLFGSATNLAGWEVRAWVQQHLTDEALGADERRR